jgi:cysteine desulfurase
MGLRPGTLNVPAIVGFGEATQLTTKDQKRIAEFRDKVYDGLVKAFGDDLEVNGFYDALNPNLNAAGRLAGNLNFHIKGVEAEGFFAKLKMIALSSGSACHAHSMAPSHVIQALDPYDSERAFNSIRMSVSHRNLEEITATEVVEDIVQAAKALLEHREAS